MISDTSKNFLLKLSREAIRSRFSGRNLEDAVNIDSVPEDIKQDGACFVTLMQSGNLRGCIGSLQAYRPLFEDVISNSQNAAFRDPRFAPVSKNDMKDIKIEISILSPREQIEYTDFRDMKKKVRPGVHGVYLTYANYSATFLPQVWEQLPTHEQFFVHLAQKAGLAPEFIFKNHAKIEVYTVDKFKE